MPYKNLSDKLLNNKKWKILNSDKVSQSKKRYYLEIKKNKPWRNSFTNAKQRCTNPKRADYKWYGGKGIKFQLSEKQVVILWKRDKAHLLKRPCLDRKNSNLNYSLKNCRFIEREYNTSISTSQRWFAVYGSKLKKDFLHET